MPAIWVGDEPDSASVALLNPAIHHATAYQCEVCPGIKARVQRDGLFWFDFGVWPRAPMLHIPAHTVEAGGSIPQAVHEAECKAERLAVVRAQVMNAHQACLTTAEWLVERRSAGMGIPVNSWNTSKAWSDTRAPGYAEDVENPHSLARIVLNNSYLVPRAEPLPRRSVETPVIAKSFELLGALLTHQEHSLLDMVDVLYISAHRRAENRPGESVVLAWAVCERLVSIAWRRLLESKITHPAGATRMNKERRKKLEGRDYTASVMVEMLEISGTITTEVYGALERGCKARNAWAHNLESPDAADAYTCIEAAQMLLREVLGVELKLQVSGRGSVPQIGLALFEKHKKRDTR